MSANRVTLDHSIEIFMKTDKVRKLADRTLISYRRTFDALRRAAGSGRTLVSNLTQDDFHMAIAILALPASEDEVAVVRARKFGSGVTRTGRSEISLNIDRSNLRQFAKFLQGRGFTTLALASELVSKPVVRTDSVKREPLRPGSEARLLDLAGARHPRDRIAVALALLAGPRESELKILRWRHVHWDTPEGPVLDFPRPKQHYEFHRVGISPLLELELRTWWTWYAERFPQMNDNWFVVPARKHGAGTVGGMPSVPMHPDWPIVPNRSPHAILPSIKPLLAQMGFLDLDGKGMHTLRRTFANMLYATYRDVRIVQFALGHAYQHTTEGYLDMNLGRSEAIAKMRMWAPAITPITNGHDNVVPLKITTSVTR